MQPNAATRVTLNERFTRIIIGGTRITAGLLWLANLHWKRPSGFGKANGSGLYKYVKYGIDHPTFPPYSWVLRHLIAPHMSLFGWMTLLLEASIAALLILGWQTKFVALAAAGQAAAIGLSVAQAPNEWPWSYVLMVALHLMLVATDAGKFGGLDGMRADRRSARRGVLVLGAAGVLVGIAGVVAAANSSFTDRAGSLVGQVSYELKFVRFNLLAALLCVTIGVFALVGWKFTRSLPVWIASGLALVAALQVVVQWRTTTSGETGGILGGTGGTLGWWLLLMVGFAVTAREMEV
jgi:uncharacterized membrane protein YphA (DoxX/SURF4 family)